MINHGTHPLAPNFLTLNSPLHFPQFRIISYAAMGLIHASDWGLYSACIGCHAVGMLLGNQAGRIISQATFNLLLLGMGPSWVLGEGVWWG